MKKETSWETSGSWYDKIVGNKGSNYHTSIIFPRALRLLNLQPGASLLDLGCGNGAFARHLPKKVDYTGIDLSQSLLKKARVYGKQTFLQKDVTTAFSLKKTFDAITFLLSLQNMEDMNGALQTAAHHAKGQTRLLLVLNHPCFRIPRQSGWIIDPKKKIQSRRVDTYRIPLSIPIATHPSQKDSPITYSFHRSLEDYAKALRKVGFAIVDMEEWISDKTSTGRCASMENRARKNFPLFLALLCQKGSFPLKTES